MPTFVPFAIYFNPLPSVGGKGELMAKGLFLAKGGAGVKVILFYNFLRSSDKAKCKPLPTEGNRP